jgi:hypothetical protein
MSHFGPMAQAVSIVISRNIGRLDKKSIVEIIIKLVMAHPDILPSLKEYLSDRR